MKKTSVRRGLAWILILVMLLSAVPFGVFAEGAEGTAAENQEAPAPEGSPAGDQENQEPPETPETPKTPETPENPESKADTPEKPEGKTEEPEGKTGEVQNPANAPAAQEGESGPVDQGDNQEDDTPKCVCDENGDKCTAEEHNEECPVCSKDGADYEKCCNGKMTAEAEDKKTAEEEAAEKAAKKAAEEEAAKKAAEEAAKKAAEEAAQKASKEAVKNVQEKIDALPAADTITAENRGAVEEALTAIDDAKEKLTDEEREKLDFTNYKAAADALSALDRMPGAGVPVTLEEAGAGLKLTVSVRKKDMTTVLADNGSVTLIKEGETQEDTKGIDPTTGVALFENLGAGTYQLSAKVTVNGIEKTTENTVVISQEDLGATKEVPVTVIEPKVTISTTIDGDMPICSSSDLSISGLENLEAELEKVENTDVTIAIQVNISRVFASSLDLIYGCKIEASWNRIVEGNEESVTADEWNLLQKKGCWLVVPMRTSGYKFDVTNDGKSFAGDGCIISRGDVVEDTNGEAPTVFQRNENSLGIRLITFTDVWAFRITAIQSRTARIKFNGNGDGAQVTKESIGVARFQEGEQWYCSLLDSRICASRPGYVFQGWATTPDAAQSNVTKNSLIPIDGGEVTLYAVWTTAPRTITFDSDGGTACNAAQTGTDGKLTRLPEPTKDGYVFRGWKNGNDFVSKDTVFNADTTLTACWTLVQTDNCVMELEPLTKEQLDLWMNGREYNPLDTVEVYAAPTAPKEEQETKAKEVLNSGNVRLIGFDIGVTLKIGDTIPVTDTQKTIRLTLPVNCLNFGGKLTILRTHDGEIKEIPQRAPANDEEEGWYQDSEGKIHLALRYFSDYAVAYVPYTVTFDSKGGSSCQPETTLVDGTLETLPTPTRTGYTFDGWYLTEDCTGTKLDESHVYTADTTVYAKWNPWTYTVIFDGNGGKVKNSVNTSETVSAEYGSEVTPPEFVKDYYTVTGWAKNADGTEKVESPIKDLAASNGERITLYAQWEYAPRTVTFDANGIDNNGKATKGTVTEEGTEKASVTRKTQESPINTLKTVPVPNAQEGYYFEGWYYKDRANKEQPVEIGKTEFTADTTVYAKWKVFEPVTVTLKCQRGTMTVDGKSVSQGTMQTKWPGVLDGTLPTPARTGYKFQGWYTYAGVKVDENTVFLRDTTIYARWVSAVSRTGNPKTGDQIALEAAVAVLVLAAVGLGAAVIIKKKQNKK